MGTAALRSHVMPNQDEITTEHAMPAASNDQLLTRMAGQLSGLVATVNTIELVTP